MLRLADEEDEFWSDDVQDYVILNEISLLPILQDENRLRKACETGFAKLMPNNVSCTDMASKMALLVHQEETLRNVGLSSERPEKMKVSQHVSMESLSLEDTFKMNNFPPAIIKLFRGFFGDYLDHIGMAVKRNLIAGYLETTLEADTFAIIVSVLQDAGPGTHKMIQLVGNKIQDKELREATSIFKANIAPMQLFQLEKTLQRAFEINSISELVPRYFAEFDSTFVTSASISQGHRARLLNGEAVFVRVKRPSLESDPNQAVSIFRGDEIVANKL